MAKRLILIILTSVVGLVFWLAIKPWATDPTLTLSSYHYWLWALLFLSLLSASVALSFMMIPERRLKLTLSFILGLEYVSVFGFGLYLWIGLLVLIWGHYIAIKNIASELTERHKINAASTVRRGLNAIIFPILILISFAYFDTPALQTMAQEGKLPPQIIGAVEKTVPKLLTLQIGGVDKAQLAFLEKRYTKEVTDQVNKIVKPYLVMVPPVLAFGLFLILQSLNFVFVNLSAWIAMSVFYVLRTTGFVKISKKQVEAEVLEI